MLAKVVVELDIKFGWCTVGWRFSGFFFLARGVGGGDGGTSTTSGGEGIIGEGGSMIGEDGGGVPVSGTSTLSPEGTDFFFFFGFFFFFFLATFRGASSSSTSSTVTVDPILAVNARGNDSSRLNVPSRP